MLIGDFNETLIPRDPKEVVSFIIIEQPSFQTLWTIATSLIFQQQVVVLLGTVITMASVFCPKNLIEALLMLIGALLSRKHLLRFSAGYIMIIIPFSSALVVSH